jgi:CheY-like chemotaxis protein/signal transduction histidine kinase
MTYDEFAAGVQEALSHLYDTAFLQRDAFLAMIAGDADDLRRIQEARRRLLAAIRGLRPGPGVPAEAPDWRAYQILHLRYIEGLSPGEAMAKVGLGKSQFFREQARALDLIAQILWQARADGGTQAAPSPAAPSPARDDAAETPVDRQHLAQIEVERLCAGAVWQQVAAGAVLADVRPLLVSLARVKQVELVFAPVDEFTIMHGEPSLLRQVLLNLVSYALDIAGACLLRISTFSGATGQGIGVAVQRQGQQQDAPAARSHRLGVGLEICRRLMEAMGGRVDISFADAENWCASLVWRCGRLANLLVVDDNASFHQLCRRYLSGYPWHVIGATTGPAARQIVAHQPPDIILLDIMMPNEDGWQLLAALKGSASTQAIPIIVCSVLNEPDLAGALGASAYLTKPVTQQALLDALARAYPGHTSPARAHSAPRTAPESARPAQSRMDAQSGSRL